MYKDFFNLGCREALEIIMNHSDTFQDLVKKKKKSALHTHGIRKTHRRDCWYAGSSLTKVGAHLHLRASYVLSQREQHPVADHGLRKQRLAKKTKVRGTWSMSGRKKKVHLYSPCAYAPFHKRKGDIFG